jgi:hypothetical protein
MQTYFGLKPTDIGQGKFFADQTYHFQTLRALSDVPSDRADTSEVLETIKHIRSGDGQGWFKAWSETGDRVASRAAAATDRIARGRALLRVHNYCRTSEFFLPSDDPKRPVSAAKNIQAFYAGLDALESPISKSKCHMATIIISMRFITLPPRATPKGP